jgi:thioredoxin-like negative regulator of GroEL
LVEELARAHAGRLKVVRLNVDEAPGISARLEARSIPTLIVFRDGEEADRLAGAPPKAELESWVERHLGAPASSRSSG